ncbi:glycosyltransferase family 2 protein [Scandinavium sp. M-37]|uniref:glycosyltransferase family 2 protein n=1 Tax=Scandinavium sp. M-37 TaxID=3373077 RepID=UPI003746D20D
MFISIVSHGHSDLINRIGTIKALSSEFTIIVTDNVGQTSLKNFCLDNGVHYIENKSRKGFGENNNQNYQYAVAHLQMKPDDYFLVLNPDVSITAQALRSVQGEMVSKSARIATINLVKEKGEYDANIRNFPKIKDFITSYLYKKNDTIIDKDLIDSSCYVDWASGSFLLFQSSLYKEINGFDERYFMYCEDLDICRRAYTLTNERVLYIPTVKALHLAAHNNRKLFSKHFLWHVKSVLRYCVTSNY